ncbi:MAG TPA: ABC transporter permease [Clostridiales bacterium]|nr:ABC transporter permease [Clostridiales bacterium]
MNKSGLWILYKKELADHLHSKRFFIVLFIIAITGFSSIFAAGKGIVEAIGKQESDTFVFLRLFTASDGSIPSFISFMSFLGPFVGLALGFDSINGERNRGTLSRLMAQPIARDSIINGKFLAGVTIIALMVFVLGVAIGALGIIMTGVPPTVDELFRIFTYLVLTIFYMSFWLALSQLFSILFKQTATSALAVIAVWLFLAIFLGLLINVLADFLYPLNSTSTLDIALKNSKMKLYLNRISPTTLYDETTITLLNPGVRSLGFVSQEQLIGAIPSALPFLQSLMIIWPHFVSLIAINMICFTISYIYFMKQEIRA